MKAKILGLFHKTICSPRAVSNNHSENEQWRF